MGTVEVISVIIAGLGLIFAGVMLLTRRQPPRPSAIAWLIETHLRYYHSVIVTKNEDGSLDVSPVLSSCPGRGEVGSPDCGRDVPPGDPGELVEPVPTEPSDKT